MEYDDLIKNVKAGLLKAASDGKKKGVAAGIKQAAEIFNKKLDEFKESLNAELEKLNVDSAEEDSSNE